MISHTSAKPLQPAQLHLQVEKHLHPALKLLCAMACLQRWLLMSFAPCPLQMRTSQTFLRDSTVTSPVALLLFGGKLEVVHEGGYVLVDSWIRIRVAAPTAVLMNKLRQGLDALLQQKVQQPQLELSTLGGPLVATIIRLLQDEQASLGR